MKVELFRNPNPKFSEVASIIAKGPPPNGWFSALSTSAISSAKGKDRGKRMRGTCFSLGKWTML